MEYVRCDRCEINYKAKEDDYCVICKNELRGVKNYYDEETLEELICPFCEKREIAYGEEMCTVCKSKKERTHNFPS